MSIKFKLTCESCRRNVEHKATAEQYQKLLQKLRCTFPCPCCSTMIQVEMMAEGLSYSTIMPTSGVAREVSDQSGNRRTSDTAFRETSFPVAETEKTPFSIPADASLNGPVSHVPFLPIGNAPVRKFKGSVLQQFFHWYNTQSMLVQCVVLSPLLILLVLLLLWDPNRDSAKPAISDSVVEEPKQSSKKSDAGANSHVDERVAAEASEEHQPPASHSAKDTVLGTATDTASSNENP